MLQGQRVFQLLSDPFGWQWDLFGIARWYPDIAFVDGARLTWFVAVMAIVVGLMAAIWWSHRVVLDAGVPPGRSEGRRHQPADAGLHGRGHGVHCATHGVGPGVVATMQW